MYVCTMSVCVSFEINGTRDFLRKKNSVNLTWNLYNTKRWIPTSKIYVKLGSVKYILGDSKRSEFNQREIFYHFYSFENFSCQLYLEVFHWSLSDSKSPQVSRILLSILANLHNAVVWFVSTCPLIYKSSCPFSYTLGIVLSAPITIGITVIFMFHYFFSSLAKPGNLSLFAFLNFILWSAGTVKKGFFIIITSLRVFSH